jgi:hypothetical protein
MRSFHKLFTIATCLLLGGGALCAKSKEEKPKDAGKKKEPSKKEKAAAAEKDKGDGRMSLPLPEGHDSLGLKIPYFDTQGRLQMNFNIGVASRIDPDHVRMGDLQVETFDDDGDSEMTIDLPNSTLNLSTRIISTKTHVVIRRADFEITGETMEFNTETRQGKLGGNVRMVIYNLSDETPSPTEPKTP